MSPRSAATCPHCADVADLEFSATDRNLGVSAELFHYFRCRTCALIFQARPPADLNAYYPANYYTIPKSIERLELLAGREQFKLDLIRPFCVGGALLEVGPAWGSFAYAAKLAGYSVSVVETDDACRQFLSEVVGVDVRAAAADGGVPAGLPNYDVVALWQVVEHLPDFERVLGGLAEHVKPTGIIAIATPNPASWQFEVMGRFWPHIDAPRHLQLIPAEVLIDILASYGFELVDRTTTDPGGLGWNRFGWQRLIGNVLPRWRPFHAAALLAGALAGWLLAPLENRPDRGAAYTLILRRANSSLPSSIRRVRSETVGNA